MREAASMRLEQVVVMVLSSALVVLGRVGEGRGSMKLDTRKCCLITEVLVEQGPGRRPCTPVQDTDTVKKKLGRPGLNPMRWQGQDLSKFAIHHGKPQCDKGERLEALYHHNNEDGFSHQLELGDDGSLVYTKPGGEEHVLRDEKYCVDTLWVSHNYSHVPEETLANFAYVCLAAPSLEEVVHRLVYPVGVAVSMGCLTLTFLLYILLPQLRDLTGGYTRDKANYPVFLQVHLISNCFETFRVYWGQKNLNICSKVDLGKDNLFIYQARWF